jgi:hypothetical protein
MQDIKREYIGYESSASMLNMLNITWEYVEYARHQVGVNWLWGTPSGSMLNMQNIKTKCVQRAG